MRVLNICILCSYIFLQACLGASVSGNAGGSDPVNEAESREYKRAILKCYKTGGSRIVKVEGRLMCY